MEQKELLARIAKIEDEFTQEVLRIRKLRGEKVRAILKGIDERRMRHILEEVKHL